MKTYSENKLKLNSFVDDKKKRNKIHNIIIRDKCWGKSDIKRYNNTWKCTRILIIIRRVVLLFLRQIFV